jgi:hypothetical protein
MKVFGIMDRVAKIGKSMVRRLKSGKEIKKIKMYTQMSIDLTDVRKQQLNDIKNEELEEDE